MNKAECFMALSYFYEQAMIDDDCELNNEYYLVLQNLIDEHFDEKENAKVIANIVIDEDKMKEIADEAIKNFFDPEPYKFEELKPNMWVWCDKYKIMIKIENIINNVIYPYEDYFCDPCDISHNLWFEFEENRFYPVTKAMQYQEEKQND